MENKSYEDLDVLYILNGIKNAILNVVRSIGRLIHFSIRNIRLLLIFIAIGAAVALTLFYFSKPYYKSTLTVAHSRLSVDYCAELVNQLDTYIDGDGNSGLAEILGLDENLAKKVKSIEYKPLATDNARKYTDSMLVVLPFKVEVQVYDKQVFEPLQRHIIHYLESNERALKIKKYDELSFLETEKKLVKEAQEIDSLKKIVNQSIIPRSSGNGIIYGEPIDPVNIYKRSMEVFERQLVIGKKQLLNDSFDIIIGFNKGAKKSSPGMLFYLVCGIATGYILGLIILSRK